MEVIKATDYGFRQVIRVAEDTSIPEWVHHRGEQRRDGSGALVFDDTGAPVLLTGDPVPAGETGEICYNCRYNWVVQEFIFDGPKYSGMSADELWALVCDLCGPASAGLPIVALLGRSG